MKTNKQLNATLIKIEEFKKQLGTILGKRSNFKVKDFETYINKMYGLDFYDSLEKYYEQCHGKIIEKEDIKDYIDCLGYPVIEKKYKVVEITKALNGKKVSTMVFFNYDNNDITKVYLEGDNIDYVGIYGIFEKDGETKMLNALKQWYGMTEKEVERIVKKLM